MDSFYRTGGGAGGYEGLLTTPYREDNSFLEADPRSPALTAAEMAIALAPMGDEDENSSAEEENKSGFANAQEIVATGGNNPNSQSAENAWEYPRLQKGRTAAASKSPATAATVNPNPNRNLLDGITARSLDEIDFDFSPQMLSRNYSPSRQRTEMSTTKPGYPTNNNTQGLKKNNQQQLNSSGGEEDIVSPEAALLQQLLYTDDVNQVVEDAKEKGKWSRLEKREQQRVKEEEQWKSERVRHQQQQQAAAPPTKQPLMAPSFSSPLTPQDGGGSIAFQKATSNASTPAVSPYVHPRHQNGGPTFEDYHHNTHNNDNNNQPPVNRLETAVGDDFGEATRPQQVPTGFAEIGTSPMTLSTSGKPQFGAQTGNSLAGSRGAGGLHQQSQVFGQDYSAATFSNVPSRGDFNQSQSHFQQNSRPQFNASRGSVGTFGGAENPLGRDGDFPNDDDPFGSSSGDSSPLLRRKDVSATMPMAPPSATAADFDSEMGDQDEYVNKASQIFEAIKAVEPIVSASRRGQYEKEGDGMRGRGGENNGSPLRLQRRAGNGNVGGARLMAPMQSPLQNRPDPSFQNQQQQHESPTPSRPGQNSEGRAVVLEGEEKKFSPFYQRYHRDEAGSEGTHGGKVGRTPTVNDYFYKNPFFKYEPIRELSVGDAYEPPENEGGTLNGPKKVLVSPPREENDGAAGKKQTKTSRSRRKNVGARHLAPPEFSSDESGSSADEKETNQRPQGVEGESDDEEEEESSSYEYYSSSYSYEYEEDEEDEEEEEESDSDEDVGTREMKGTTSAAAPVTTKQTAAAPSGQAAKVGLSDKDKWAALKVRQSQILASQKATTTAGDNQATATPNKAAVSNVKSAPAGTLALKKLMANNASRAAAVSNGGKAPAQPTPAAKTAAAAPASLLSAKGGFKAAVLAAQQQKQLQSQQQPPKPAAQTPQPKPSTMMKAPTAAITPSSGKVEQQPKQANKTNAPPSKDKAAEKEKKTRSGSRKSRGSSKKRQDKTSEVTKESSKPAPPQINKDAAQGLLAPPSQEKRLTPSRVSGSQQQQEGVVAPEEFKAILHGQPVMTYVPKMMVLPQPPSSRSSSIAMNIISGGRTPQQKQQQPPGGSLIQKSPVSSVLPMKEEKERKDDASGGATTVSPSPAPTPPPGAAMILAPIDNSESKPPTTPPVSTTEQRETAAPDEFNPDDDEKPVGVQTSAPATAVDTAAAAPSSPSVATAQELQLEDIPEIPVYRPPKEEPKEGARLLC